MYHFCLRQLSLSLVSSLFCWTVSHLVCLPSSSSPAVPWVQPDSLVTNPGLWLVKKIRLRPCMACFAPTALQQPWQLFLYSPHSPLGSLFIAIPAVTSGQQLKSFRQPRSMQSLFKCLVNVVKVLMGYLYILITYYMRISIKTNAKLWSGDVVLVEMLLSLLPQTILGFTDKTNTNMCLSAERGILWISGWIPMWEMNAILC